MFAPLRALTTSVAFPIEKVFWAFRWGGVGDEANFHLVSWDKVCSLISGAGVGVRNLRTFDKALLGKWMQWYHQKEAALWRVVIDSKYGSVWGWCSNEVRGSHGVGLWKNIQNGWGGGF